MLPSASRSSPCRRSRAYTSSRSWRACRSRSSRCRQAACSGIRYRRRISRSGAASGSAPSTFHRRRGGSLAENLEFPLALRDFGVDAFVVDAGGEAKIEVLFHHLAGDVADILVADAGVVRSLWRRKAAGGKAERT